MIDPTATVQTHTSLETPPHAQTHTCERLSEAYLLPVIEAMLEGFPFTISGFHADNGSEYINHPVARLLEKLRIEFTKSRPRHSNDNGLAETKNGAVVRKCFGYGHIPQRYAMQINAFCAASLNPYLLPPALLVRRGHH